MAANCRIWSKAGSSRTIRCSWHSLPASHRRADVAGQRGDVLPLRTQSRLALVIGGFRPFRGRSDRAACKRSGKRRHGRFPTRGQLNAHGSRTADRGCKNDASKHVKISSNSSAQIGDDGGQVASARVDTDPGRGPAVFALQQGRPIACARLTSLGANQETDRGNSVIRES